MNATFRMLLTLPLTLAACGHAGDLLLDQTSAALGCDQPGEPACVSSDDRARHHSEAYGDAGAPHDGTDDCRGDVDCGYGQVCERRHGVSHCETESRAGRAEAGDAGDPEHHGGPDAGAACDRAADADDDHRGPGSGDSDRGDSDRGDSDRGDSDRDDTDGRDEDRSGSNSGRR